MTPRSLHSSPLGRGGALLIGAVALLGGCASISPDGGFAPVQRTAQQHLNKELQWARGDDDQQRIDRRVAELLAKPLTADDAVQLALLNNRGLQASYFELGIGEAELVQAARLPNPGFTFAHLKGGDGTEIDRRFDFNLARLIALPTIHRLETARFAQSQAAVAAAVLGLAADTRRAWVEAVAAEEAVRYSALVMQSAEASAELARRMAQVGNYNKLQRSREEGFNADAALNVARAQQRQHAARERLTRLLGLWGEQTAFQLPERLPDLPAAPLDLPDAERTAIAQRLDVQAARAATEETARNLGLTQATRFVNVLEVGWQNNGFSQQPPQRGWEVSLELPLFDWGDARVARAQSVYMQSLQRAAQTAIDARSEVREAYGAYRSAWDIARHHRDEIVPLRRRIAEENLQRYNGMLIGVFELLADARAQIASVDNAIAALRDFWLAQADLDTALVGKPVLAMPAKPSALGEPGGAAH